MAGITGLRYNFSRTDIEDTPLFERQMNNDEYSEYQQLRGIIDGLHQRISKLEKINTDLEGRLEEQAKQSMAVETELISMERSWKLRCEQLSEEISKWKTQYDTEKMKNNRLRDHLSNTEKELYIILQRKHELMRGGPGITSSSMKGNHNNNNHHNHNHHSTNSNGLMNGKLLSPAENGGSGGLKKSDLHDQSDSDSYQMPNKMKEQSKQKEPKIIREKKAIANLSDFLGF